MNREELLKAAIERVQAGSKEYGKVEDNFSLIASFWNEYISSRQEYAHIDLLEPPDVSAMMILLKIARAVNGKPKIDTWLDIAGYAACAVEAMNPPGLGMDEPGWRADKAPAADDAPVLHRRWIHETGYIYHCTVCGAKAHVVENMGVPAWGFCPNCGAKMDEPEGESEDEG